MRVTYTKWGKDRKITGGAFIRPRKKTKITKNIDRKETKKGGK